MTPMDAVLALQKRFPDVTAAPVTFRGDVSLEVPARHVLAIARFLKDECGFDMLTDLCGVDNLGTEPRFSVDYILYSFTHRCRLRLRASLTSAAPEIDSLTGVWGAADWAERETFDMHGIRFRGHPNLKRILMWEGYPHHPLRKDFPLAGLPADLPATAVDAGRVETAPMEGGPFVASPAASTIRREPRQSDTLAERQERLNKPAREEPV